MIVIVCLFILVLILLIKFINKVDIALLTEHVWLIDQVSRLLGKIFLCNDHVLVVEQDMIPLYLPVLIVCEDFTIQHTHLDLCFGTVMQPSDGL